MKTDGSEKHYYNMITICFVNLILKLILSSFTNNCNKISKQEESKKQATYKFVMPSYTRKF